MSHVSRFWDRVPASDGCWEWQGTRATDGYGVFWDGTRQVRAHRYSWELHNGPIPPGLNVCHHCDNPPCVNPAHLFVGTHADNVADKMSKGRHRSGKPDQWGERNPAARLTAAQVAEIKALALAGYTTMELAPRYGVTFSNIAMILRGLTWAGVPAGPSVEPVQRVNYRSKLTRQDAETIRATYTGARGEKTRLAERYGVSRPAIGAILRGESYR
jgi:hypothetical protein